MCPTLAISHSTVLQILFLLWPMQKLMLRDSRYIFKTHNEDRQSYDSKQSLSNSKALPLICDQHSHFKLCCWQDVVAHTSNAPRGNY